MKRGEKNRFIRQTSMNTKSSRSHTIFQILLESLQADSKGMFKVIVGLWRKRGWICVTWRGLRRSTRWNTWMGIICSNWKTSTSPSPLSARSSPRYLPNTSPSHHSVSPNWPDCYSNRWPGIHSHSSSATFHPHQRTWTRQWTHWNSFNEQDMYLDNFKLDSNEGKSDGI